MSWKLQSYLPIFLMVFAIVGCTELSTQSTGSHNMSGALAMASETHSAGNTEIPARQIRSGGEERVKQQIKDSRKGIYLVDNKDVLDIKVFEEPDLSMTIRVSERGAISYPLIGEVVVKGLTVYEVEKTLEKRLRDGEYLNEPEVNVRLNIELMKQYSEKEIFVIGEVKKSGPIPILGKYITVLEAITMAGGFTKISAPSRTTVVRVEDGVEKTIRVNLNKVKKGDKFLDITLRAGDVVVVPKTRF